MRRKVKVGRPSRRHLTMTVIAAVIAFLFQTLPALAAQPGSGQLKDLNLEQLGNIEVTTASKEPESVWKTPAAVFVLTNEDIRRSGATSIPEVLRLVPGVEVSRVSSNTWAIGIRGFGSGFSKNVLVLIDGRSVYTPLFAGVYWDVQNVMLEDVERIEVIRGPGGTIWGANAVNGVINIITKDSKDTHGAIASAGAGNVDQGMGSARYGAGNSKFSYRVYGTGFGRAPEAHPDNLNYDDWQLGQAGFRTDWNASSRDSLTLQGDLYKGEVGQRVTIATYQPPAERDYFAAQDVSGGNLLAHWKRDLREGSDLQVQAYYDRTYRMGPQLGETRDTFDIDLIHHIANLPRQDIIWGLGGRWSPSQFIQTFPTVEFVPHNKSDNIYSIFGQDQVALVKKRLALTVGTKLQHNVYTGWEVQPSVRLLWTPQPHQSFWAAVSRAVRTPSRLEEDLQLTGLVAPNPPFFLRIADNGQVVSETLVGYEAGFRQLVNSRFYFDISLFHNDYDDLVGYGPLTFSMENTPAPPHLLYSVPFANSTKGQTDGIEIAPDLKISKWLQLRGSYSYLNLDLRAMPGSADAGTAVSDEGSSPHNEFSGQALFNLPRGFEFDSTVRYMSGLPAQSIKGYTTMDTRLGWRLNRHLDFSLVGQNLFAPRHAEFSSAIFIERSAYAKLTWTK
jgi:iron complex outermembrane receptor protein